jgi:integrase
MKPKTPLTDRSIRSLRPAPEGKRRLAWDALVPGLAVRVTDRGEKSFVLVTRYPGSPHPTPRSLGKVGAISLADARDKARAWHKLISSGVDPAKAQAEAAANTFQAICDEYMAREGSKLRSAEWRRQVLERLVYPALGPKPISEIRRSDIVQLLDKIQDQRGPAMADKALGIIRKAMNWHASRSDDFRSPIVRGMARDAGTARDRILTDDELRSIWRASEGSLFGSYVRFLLLTAARRTEAASMEWAELASGDWTLPAARNKTNQDLVRPLSKTALATLPPPNGKFVFGRRGKPLAVFGDPKTRLDEASGVTGWTLHDLRRTARSLMSRAGVPTDHAERCLGHVIGGVRGTYDRHEYHAEKARAFEALAGLVARIVDPKANVVPLRGA